MKEMHTGSTPLPLELLFGIPAKKKIQVPPWVILPGFNIGNTVEQHFDGLVAQASMYAALNRQQDQRQYPNQNVTSYLSDRLY